MIEYLSAARVILPGAGGSTVEREGVVATIELLEEGVRVATAQGAPIFLHYTGYQ